MVKQFRPQYASLLRVTNIASMIAGLAIIISLSYDILRNHLFVITPAYLEVQLIACLVLIMDFVVHWYAAHDRARYFRRNCIFLLVSIPFLNIALWSGANLSREWYFVLKMAPLIRSFAAVAIVVEWLVNGRIKMLFAGYLFTVVAFTYLAALIFYCYEYGVNPKVDNFGNSLWWACMNVTTVGAAIFPVTAIGKTLAVLLPSLGMMMFPVFTIYVTNLITQRHDKP